MHTLTWSLLLAAVSPLIQASTSRYYTLQDTYIGQDFVDKFNHEAIKDPTNGRVEYVDKATALNLNLTYASGNTLILRADYKTTLTSTGSGRKSVRLISQKQYKNHISILELRHMPVGCGTWPAYWTTSNSATWPTVGEIDILEGVNDQVPNMSTLHTTAGCKMTASNMIQSGTLKTSSCNWQDNNNSGCSVAYTKGNNYGPALNNAGGGWYAVERSATGINVWFWARNEDLTSVPLEVRTGLGVINPGHWGKPVANFVVNECNMDTYFNGGHNYIINLTFCGDWAGNAYSSSGCPSTCIDYVNNNPGAFANAYWDIASLKIYQPSCTTGLKKRDDVTEVDAFHVLKRQSGHSIRGYHGHRTGSLERF